MYGLKKVNFLYLILLAILVYGFSSILTYAQYDYKLGLSRLYNSDNIVGTGFKDIYNQNSFTGIAFCTGYYYVNHHKTASPSKLATFIRQSLRYDSGQSLLVSDYINLINSNYHIATLGSDDINDGGTGYGYANYGGNDFYIYSVSTDGSIIPNTFSVGRLSILNKTYNVTGNFYLNYLNPTSTYWYSTHIVHNTMSPFPSDTGYAVSIVYYAQPCVPDTYITGSDVATINGIGGSTTTANGALARVPAFHGKNATLSGGRPVTTASETSVGRSNTGNFLPGERNTSSFQNHITFDDGIFIAGIKEPDLSSAGPDAFSQKYGYNSTSLTGSTFGLLTPDFEEISGLTNQRGINPDTIKVYVTFTGIDKTDFGDTGQPCTVVISGADLGLEGLLSSNQYSWNRNRLGYSVNITSGTIRNLAKAQCSSAFDLVNAVDIDLKRETVANISWDAYDYANSMIISQDYNTEVYRGANRITGVTGYNFNSHSSNPTLSMATDSTGLINSNTVYNIPVNNQNLNFTGTDTYAGINSETFLIIVTGQESSVTKSDSWQAGTVKSYIYSGTDINKFGYAGPIDRENYTGFVDFINKLIPTTGMHFTVYFEATDFVGNKRTQNYTFRTPTWPNAPESTGSLNKTAQTRSPIDPINIIDNIKDVDTVDGGGSQYNYSTYYPSHQALIADFAYISGSQNLTGNQALVLTGENGNVGGATVVTMTGLTFVYDGSSSYITGTPYVSNGGSPMDDYLATDFNFSILATNIYGITGIIKYNITVAPSCTESPGCTDPVYVFWGTTLANAKAQKQAALNSGTDYMKANHWYPHWFAEIKQTGPNFYFTGVDSESGSKVLYCATTGNQLLINYGGYSGPQSNPLSVSSQTFTGSTLIVSGSVVNLFDNSAFPVELTANYEMVPDNGNEKMTIYVNRPLTGRVFYSVCEFTGGLPDVFGCSVHNGNYTGDVNWTKLTDQDVFTMTGWVEGGWITGSEAAYWGTDTVSNGGGTRKYVKTITGNLREDININSTIDIESRNGSTNTINHEVYWIDNIEASMTGLVTVVANQSAIVTLSGYNTGILSTISQADLIGDDEYIVTKFSGSTEAKIFQGDFGSTIHTGQYYIDGTGSTYKMIHEIRFAQDREGEICVEDRAGNESCIPMNVSGIGTMKELVITVKPAFRPEPSESVTGYSIVDGDFWFWVKSGSTWTQNYNSVTKADPKITTNKNGTGLVYIMTPATGAEYLVVFKGSGTLSAGFTGTWDSSITEMNFFTGDYANKLDLEHVYKYNNAGTIENYLKVGDVSLNGSGDYDTVTTADFNLMNNDLTIGAFTAPIRYDFDLNYVISSMEQSMILQAWGSHGFIGWLEFNDIIDMTGFIDL